VSRFCTLGLQFAVTEVKTKVLQAYQSPIKNW